MGVYAPTLRGRVREAPPESFHKRRALTPIPAPSPFEGEGSLYPTALAFVDGAAML